MDKYEIAHRIESFAPLELAENWDCSGWGVDIKGHNNISKVMICLTVTNDVVKQAKEQACDLIVSHHPLFYVPLEWKDINIYSAHTNLDRAQGGTTDTLIKELGFEISGVQDFLRFVDEEFEINDFLKILRTVSPNLRYVNNKNVTHIKKIAFCAGSGADFINLAKEYGADAFVTGDIKFHTALESEIVLFDVGHFESEILVLSVFERLLEDIETVKAREKSPFFVK